MGIPGPHGAPICIARSLAEVEKKSTAAEETLLEKAIEGAKVGDIYTLRAWGTRLNNSGESKGFRPKLILGATTILDVGAVSFATSAEKARWRIEARIILSSLTAQVIEGETAIGGPGASSGTLSSTGQFVGPNVASATENMAAAKTLKLTVTLGASSAEIRAILNGWTLHRERA
jgi:hypothetical protein